MVDLSAIKAFILDVDGVLTDGTLLALNSGEQARTFHIRDGYAIRHALRKGYRIVIISGRQEEGVRRRLESLDVQDIYLGVDDKMVIFNKYINLHRLDPATIAYMGDDMPDVEVMRRCGLAACPADAADDVRAISAFVASLPGGKGAVRELLEATMKQQGTW
ncbi:3-deoxy-D-manno-octulosonate 8-phosphate phosphatase [Hymenobacter lutimineralis]|uniref:3-deoxy-D-manno-octulosonate 8-phosphate phosphatase n=1 Tax=Hymenobacter lutimineralis TaxID=2606448 RepID=A0A5D6V4W1_9BACT|nr:MULTISPECIES: 3-deoxy-D-manno-octulosonate 8-phosphate phosphatase [Hymenobacter]QIX62138.1 3-deoxy-D-manno-octulosonate 8-phosphate phosphatase [Hymenobacter sp. BT18]TYZ10142.1 3-deoxy-D-manno-octulosonate 8-phosphate phosphatase [Hymenobacter lutimineralis]